VSRPPLSVSVVICAYTQARWDDLSAAVASALSQPDATEVIVVIDYEDALLARATNALTGPRVRVVPNREKQGLSGARNTGVHESSSALVAFLDDDAEATATWLGELVGCMSSDDIVGVGGRAEPRWPNGAASSTLPPELLWVVGCTYVGQPTELSEVRNVIGCSMLFRRERLLAVGGFNLNTGRIGSIPLGGEETELCIKLRQADPSARILFQPLSIVNHRVSADRTTWRYLSRRSFFEGVSKSALSRDLGSDALSSERSYTTRVLPIGAIRQLAGGRPLGAAAIVLSLGAAAAGFVYGSLKVRRRSRDALAVGNAATIDLPSVVNS
jgi:GT2 family glycosyltransferase